MVKKMMFLIICVLAVCLSSCKNSIDDSSINEDKSFDISDDLITELKLNFKYFFKIVEVMPEPKHETIEIRLDLIKKGYKMIYVKFNPDDYYYACAYHVSDDEDNLYKNYENYVWRGYQNPEDIRSTYGEKVLVKAFQINKTIEGIELTSNTKILKNIENYTTYDVSFDSNGFNTNKAKFIDNENVFLISEEIFNAKCFYFKNCTYLGYERNYHHQPFTVNYLIKNEKIYIHVRLRSEYINGEVYYNDLEYDFGKYYSKLIDILQYDGHKETFNNYVSYYGLLDLEEVIEITKIDNLNG